MFQSTSPRRAQLSEEWSPSFARGGAQSHALQFSRQQNSVQPWPRPSGLRGREPGQSLSHSSRSAVCPLSKPLYTQGPCGTIWGGCGPAPLWLEPETWGPGADAASSPNGGSNLCCHQVSGWTSVPGPLIVTPRAFTGPSFLPVHQVCENCFLSHSVRLVWLSPADPQFDPYLL